MGHTVLEVCKSEYHETEEKEDKPYTLILISYQPSQEERYTNDTGCSCVSSRGKISSRTSTALNSKCLSLCQGKPRCTSQTKRPSHHLSECHLFADSNIHVGGWYCGARSPSLLEKARELSKPPSTPTVNRL